MGIIDQIRQWLLRISQPPRHPDLNNVELYVPHDQHKQPTVRVRVAVAVLDNGRWHACGDHTCSDQDTIKLLRNYTKTYSENNKVVHFIEADVPLPESYTIKANPR